MKAYSSYTIVDVIDGLQWQGDLSAAPSNPKEGWAYYNTTEKMSYIYDGEQWVVFVRDGEPGADGAKGDPGADGKDGENGKSAYEIYLENLPEGSTPLSEEEWLASLKGANGKDGENGKDGMNGSDGKGISTTTEQYYVSSSNTGLINGVWIDYFPEGWPGVGYIWKRTKTDWTDGDITYTTPTLMSQIEAATQAAAVEGAPSLARWCLKYGVTLIDGSTIATGTIDASRLSVDSLSAINANLGTVTAGVIQSSDYVSGTSGLQLDLTNGTADITGTITAQAGKIAEYTISGNKLISGKVGMSSDKTSGAYSFWAGNATPGNAPFNVTNKGAIKASYGTIANMTFTGEDHLDLVKDSSYLVFNIGDLYSGTSAKAYASLYFTGSISCDIKISLRIYYRKVASTTSAAASLILFDDKIIAKGTSGRITFEDENDQIDLGQLITDNLGTIDGYVYTCSDCDVSILSSTIDLTDTTKWKMSAITSSTTTTPLKMGTAICFVKYYSTAPAMSKRDKFLIYIPSETSLNSANDESFCFSNLYKDWQSGIIKYNKNSIDDQVDGIYLSGRGFGIGESGYYFNDRGEIKCSSIECSSIKCNSINSNNIYSSSYPVATFLNTVQTNPTYYPKGTILLGKWNSTETVPIIYNEYVIVCALKNPDLQNIALGGYYSVYYTSDTITTSTFKILEGNWVIRGNITISGSGTYFLVQRI